MLRMAICKRKGGRSERGKNTTAKRRHDNTERHERVRISQQHNNADVRRHIPHRTAIPHRAAKQQRARGGPGNTAPRSKAAKGEGRPGFVRCRAGNQWGGQPDGLPYTSRITAPGPSQGVTIGEEGRK